LHCTVYDQHNLNADIYLREDEEEGKEEEGEEEGEGVTRMNSETVRDSAKCFNEKEPQKI